MPIPDLLVQFIIHVIPVYGNDKDFKIKFCVARLIIYQLITIDYTERDVKSHCL